MTNPDNPHSLSQLLRFLESLVDKLVDDCRYESSITAKRDRYGRS